MADLLPFRALRYVPSRVDLAACLGDGAAEPRRIARLLDPAAPASRTALFLAEWRRAGIVALDAQPSITVVKRTPEDDPDAAAFAFFAVLGDGGGPLEVAPRVVAFDDDASRRIRRTLSSAADLEPDASVTLSGEALEAFAVDDETTAARLATLIGDVQGDGPRLCFFHDRKDEWPRIPAGLAMLPASTQRQ